MQRKALRANQVLHQKLDRYTLKELLGEGAFGNVYLATDKEDGREVAIKVVPRANVHNDDEKCLLFGEQRILKKLRDMDAPAFLKMEESFADKFNYYIVTVRFIPTSHDPAIFN